MDIAQLDFIFPFVVFGYGAIMILLVQLVSLQQKRFSKAQIDMLNHLKLHQNMAYICLFVGGLWSLQNLFL